MGSEPEAKERASTSSGISSSSSNSGARGGWCKEARASYSGGALAIAALRANVALSSVATWPGATCIASESPEPSAGGGADGTLDELAVTLEVPA